MNIDDSRLIVRFQRLITEMLVTAERRSMSPQFLRHFKGVTTRVGDEIEVLAIDIFDGEAVL